MADLEADVPAPVQQKDSAYVPSRYLSLSHQDDGALVVHCARTGAVGVVPAEDAERARRVLVANQVTKGPFTGVLQDLVYGGFLVPQGTDETALVHNQYVSRYMDRSLHLIVMPTEQCNFRCVYCYESFLRGEMDPGLQEGIKRFVADQQDLEHFYLSWFGGEPLLAAETVFRLTDHFRRYTEDRGIELYTLATTNGYLLTPEYADRVIPAGLKRFQITLDGPEHEHDKRRVGANGEPTFARIWDNLAHLRRSDHDFKVVLRHNFDPESLPKMQDFLGMLKDEFGGDPRFGLEMEAIGRWGGANDASLDVCEDRALVEAVRRARQLTVEAGFRDVHALPGMQVNGNVCYAANPKSFVIGSDGKVYKCTVELDYHDRNVVGQLYPDGRMDLDWKKMALWCETDGMEEGKKCTSCYFSPTCHGAACPKEWMEEPECACPTGKRFIRDSLTLIRAESLFEVPDTAPVASCPKG
ncbi:radical SAM/SPASM domain-containing protein [Streptomyces roseoverticillatus]|uniref:radical SAM/SPASM domain-containing protein n=1 Tax=Streptomyces roseoverticillatus TaxID=66429 RepID=UPI001F3F596F|nr:radical SAM protein [Streptomyces roseoverticillatus]